eukprot:1157927-Pelagomonas_calceolata.AAC.5
MVKKVCGNGQILHILVAEENKGQLLSTHAASDLQDSKNKLVPMLVCVSLSAGEAKIIHAFLPLVSQLSTKATSKSMVSTFSEKGRGTTPFTLRAAHTNPFMAASRRSGRNVSTSSRAWKGETCRGMGDMTKC